ncbi:MAG: hypothetical protein K6B43_02555 [Treponema sp.]|nr:hypothetical protein [Treponema sp.]
MILLKVILNLVFLFMFVFIGCSNDDANVIAENTDTTNSEKYIAVPDDKELYEQNRQLYLEFSDWLDSVRNTLGNAEFSYNYTRVDALYTISGKGHSKDGRIVSCEEEYSDDGHCVPPFDRLEYLFEDFQFLWGSSFKDEPTTLWYGEITYDEFDGVKLPRTLVCYQSVEKSYGKSPYYKKYEITDFKLPN